MKNKLIIVTGGTNGLGRELVLQLIDLGYQVATIARSKTELDSLPKNVLSFCGDMTIRKDIIDFCELVKHDGRKVYSIINNAGYSRGKELIEETPIEEFEKQYEINVMAPVILAKTFIHQLKESGSGYVINILTDQVKDRTRGGWSAYSTTKHGLYGFGKVLGIELASNGIKVINAIVGGMNTTFRAEARDQYLNPKDVAETIITLLNNPKDIFIPEITIYPKCYLEDKS